MPTNSQIQSRNLELGKPTGHAYGLIGDKEVLVDPNTNDVFESAPGLQIGRKLGKVSGGRFYATGSAMGDSVVRNLDTQEISFNFPEKPAAAKPKFSMARAQKFTGEKGYEYAFDPVTNVIAILKSPNRSQGSPPVYVRPDGKFQDAHKAIMAEYRSKMLTPLPVKKESPVTPPAPPPMSEAEPSAPPPARKKRSVKNLLSQIYNSDASSGIDSDDI